MPPKNTAVRPPAKKRKTFNAISYVTNAARKAWMWSPVRKSALTDSCEECGATNVPLQVHHVVEADVYGRIKKAMELLIPKTSAELMCICKECHKLKHRRDK